MSDNNMNAEPINLWNKIESYFVRPARFFNNLIFYTTIPLILSEHFFPKLFEHFTKEISRTDTLISLLIFIMSGDNEISISFR